MNSDAEKNTHRQADLDLIRRAQQGEADAFSTLYHAHKSKIYSLCLRMTGNTAEAEDLTQDAFLQVFRKLSTFRGDSALSTWLYRVAVNTVLMHFRKKGLRQVPLDQPANEEARVVKREYGSVDGRLSAAVDRIALSRALRELPSGYRTIFVLHEVRGYEHREIAHLLRCSVGNSKSQLHKAKARMRELLGYAEPQESAAKAPRAVRAARAAQEERAPVPVFSTTRSAASSTPPTADFAGEGIPAYAFEGESSLLWQTEA